MDPDDVNEDRRFFLKHIGFGAAGMVVFSAFPEYLLADAKGRNSLPRSSPESQGVSSSEILNFLSEAEKRNAGLHSVMVIRHGSVVAEGWWAPYQADIKHGLYSLSKNITATAIGFAVQEGKLSLDDKVISFFPGDLPAVVDENLAAMTVRDLLTMSGGHGSDTLYPLLQTKEGTWARTFLSIPLKYKPGTHFVYNSGSTYMLSAIITKVSGQPMLEYLKPRLFAPLGIEGADWDSDPQGINFGAAGLRLRTEDIARFSQLYLQKGLWKGKRILSGQWIADATAFQIANNDNGAPAKKDDDDIKQGYGYHFWLSRPVAQGAYRSEGAFCQFGIVMPKQDAVIVITAEGVSARRVMDLCWDILLPAMKEGILPKNKSAEKELKDKLKSLKLIPPKGKSESPTMAVVSGKAYKIEKNTRNVESISFRFEKESTVFTLRDDKGEYRIKCGMGEWISGETNIPGSPTNLFVVGIPLPQSTWKISACGTWTDDNTFVMTWRFPESPHFDIVTCKFDKEKLQIVYANSITRILKQYKDPRPVLEGAILGLK
jgi:CubicO group peptidase (beta-lactamase class C family)